MEFGSSTPARTAFTYIYHIWYMTLLSKNNNRHSLSELFNFLMTLCSRLLTLWSRLLTLCSHPAELRSLAITQNSLNITRLLLYDIRMKSQKISIEILNTTNENFRFPDLKCKRESTEYFFKRYIQYSALSTHTRKPFRQDKIVSVTSSLRLCSHCCTPFSSSLVS